jgi:hypothetical protein
MRNITRTLAAALVLSGAMTTAALCQAAAFQTDAPECQGDAIRLCAQIPDAVQVRACLSYYQHHLTPECRPFVGPSADDSGQE